MALTSADLTRIYKYKAFTLGSRAGGSLTYNDVLDLIQEQITALNAIDTERGTTFADEIQADLDSLDTLDGQITGASGSRATKRLDVIEYFKGGEASGYGVELDRKRGRVANMLAQTFDDSDSMAGVTPLYR